MDKGITLELSSRELQLLEGALRVALAVKINQLHSNAEVRKELYDLYKHIKEARKAQQQHQHRGEKS